MKPSKFLLPRSTRGRDAVIVILTLLGGFFASIYFEPFERVATFDQAHPEWHLDDIVTALVAASFGLVWLAVRRTHEAAASARIAAGAVELERAHRELERQARTLEETAEDLARARDDAQAADRLKSHFLTNMSHELRTPLNAIIGLSEIMIKEPSDRLDESHRGYLAKILASGKRLSSVMNDLFDMSQIVAGRMVLQYEEMDLVALVEDCRGAVATQAAQRCVEVFVRGPRELPVKAAKTKIQRLLMNLLSNAIQFTPSGGRIEVGANPDEADAPWVELVVSDSGIGMTPDQAEIALLPFRQVDDDLTRQHEGAGLGLPLAKSLAELHGGSLSIDSVPGRGTTILVRLPILLIAGTATA